MSKKEVLNTKYRLICVSTSRGLQQYSARLANSMSNISDVQVSVVGQDPLLDMIGGGVNKISIPSKQISLVTFIKICRSLLVSKNTILHYQGINLPTLLLLKLISLFGWRTILTPHNVETHFPNILYNSIKWFLWKGFDMIVLHTEAELNLVPDRLKSKVCIIPHGEYSPLESGEEVSDTIRNVVAKSDSYVIAPGFIREDKNLGFLLENTSVLASCGFKLVVAGRNLSKIPDADIRAGSHYLDGFLKDKDLEYLIENAAAVILPYDNVSESGILHQALSVGTPVITTDIPGFRERVKVGLNGLILGSLNSDALHKTLKEFKLQAFDRTLIKRNHLNYFSWDRISRNLLESINENRSINK